MALALWAKSNVGANLSFVKGFSRALKSWKDIVEQAILRKFPKAQPKKGTTVTVTEEVEVDVLIPKWRQHCRTTQSYLNNLTDSLQSRVFRSIFSRSFSRPLAKDSLLRYPTRGERGFRHVPLFCLVGVTLGVDISTVLEKGNENLLTDVRGMFDEYNWEAEPLKKSPKCLNDLDIEAENSIANGCEGVVYKAQMKDDVAADMNRDAEFDLALKAIFNYSAESNSYSICQQMRREIVPLQATADEENDNMIPAQGTRLPPHPNIVEMPAVFVDDMLVTEEGRTKYPAALPRRLNREQFFGRNKTMYVVMKRRSSNLREFLEEKEISMETRCLLLAQLLEGVSHLWSHGVAHRDLKTDNLLIDLPKDGGCPRLEICDFGCCLAQENRSLHLPFPSRDLFIGGNCWLMAPEICTAEPGLNTKLNFNKSDLWAAGAIAYEILGGHNPFYPHKDNAHTQLKSNSYSEDDLPLLPDDVPQPIKKLVFSILARKPSERPSPAVAAAVAQLVVLDVRKGNMLVKTKNQMKRKRGSGVAKHVTPSLVPTTEAQKFQLVLQSSLSLLCQLTFDSEQKSLNMESVMEFLLLSKLTYVQFRMALKFF